MTTVAPPPPPPPPSTSRRPPPAPHHPRRYYSLRIPCLRNLRIPLTSICLNFPRHIERIADCFVYILGPVLILVASAIILTLSYTYFYIILPNYLGGWTSQKGFCHTLIVVFLLVNVCYNYAYCVCTRNNGERYEVVVRELADCMGFVYPETRQEMARFKNEYEQKLIHRSNMRRQRAARAAATADAEAERRRQQQSSNANGNPSSVNNSNSAQSSNAGSSSSSTNTSDDNKKDTIDITNGQRNDSTKLQPSTRPPRPPSSSPPPSSSSPTIPANNTTTTTRTTYTPPQPRVFGWMLLGPNEWGYCKYSKQPKPPRSHYDHVIKCLCLNMDHYCPWMFNVVGYFNYRYFCNFLFYVFLGMLYGTFLTYHPFFALNGSRRHRHQEHDASNYVTKREDETPVVFTFMLCLSVGLAVFCLLAFHIYLILTAQTTIEFHGNCSKRRRARDRGTSWVNPYDLGWRDNWKQVYGSMHPILAMLPSSREPEFFPFPINGELGRRKHIKSKEDIEGNRGGDGTVPTAAISAVSNASSVPRRRVGANDSERVALIV